MLINSANKLAIWYIFIKDNVKCSSQNIHINNIYNIIKKCSRREKKSEFTKNTFLELVQHIFGKNTKF